MNKERYESLTEEQKDIAKEAYTDGFRACIDQARSIKVLVGDQTVDNMFERNRDMVVSSLLYTMNKMESQ